MAIEKTFTLEEVEKLVKNAYEVGYTDGLEEGGDEDFKEYRNADDFWNKNYQRWVSEEITYIV